MIRIMHLSDLHFTPSISSNSYSIPQLRSIEEIFKAEDTQRKFDRVIVTGDLTEDAINDSFIRAKSWLMGEMPTMALPTGLKLDGQRLRLVPGNKDFDFTAAKDKTYPKLFFDGLITYNTVFPNNHMFVIQRPIIYEWFEIGQNIGLMIFYINTSFLGENDPNNKNKAKFVDFICRELHDLVEDGLSGLLKKKADDPVNKITVDEFRKAFKIIVSHHPLQNITGKDFLNSRVKRRFLANLAIMDFQLQLSGHDHKYELNESIYYTIFDRRAKNRYIISELKNITGFTKSNARLEALKSLDGRKYSRDTNTIFNLLIYLIYTDGDDDEKPSSMEEELEKIAEGKNNDDIVRYLKNLINKGKVREKVEREDLHKLIRHMESFSDEKRREFERNSKMIMSKIMNDLKHKSLVSYNPGSPSIPYNGTDNRNFNIYEIESDDINVILTRINYQWAPKSAAKPLGEGKYRVVEKTIERFSLEKIHKKQSYDS